MKHVQLPFCHGLLHAATFATCDQSYIFDWSHINKKDWLAQSIWPTFHCFAPEAELDRSVKKTSL